MSLLGRGDDPRHPPRLVSFVMAVALAAGTWAGLQDPFVPMKATWLLLLAFVARRFGRLRPSIVVLVPVGLVLTLSFRGLRSDFPHLWREEVVVVAPLITLAVTTTAVLLAAWLTPRATPSDTSTG